MVRQADEGGRSAQKRRTRNAIIEATTRLVAEGASPTIDDVAAAADVSRRTVYMYFPTLDQLLLDAALGAMSDADVDTAFAEAAEAGDTAPARVDALVRATSRLAPLTLPLGRTIIRLTVDAPAPDPQLEPEPEPDTAALRRGYRRTRWIEEAIEPLRETLSDEQRDRLVSALAVLIGWEAMIVLRDVRGLTPEREEEVLRWAAAALVNAVHAEVGGDGSAIRLRA